MPLWVKFHNVPDCYWTAKGLSKLASVVGKPLSADSFTSRLEIMPFAKICVLYTIGNPLPSSISAVDYNPVTKEKSSIDVKVSYVNKPLVCSGCHSLGHLVSACPVVTRVWVQKAVQKHSVINIVGPTNTMDSVGQDESLKGIAVEPLNRSDPVVEEGTPQQIRVDESNEWTEVRAKRKPAVVLSPSLESPSPSNTFQNVIVDEIDQKRAKPSSKARKKAKRALGRSPPQS